MKLDNLGQHPFFTGVSQDCMDIQKALGLTATDEFDDSTRFDELQFYVTRVGFFLSHTLNWAEQLQYAVHFIAEFAYSKKASAAGIKRSHHLLYNVENYLIRLPSVYDRCLQLTNAVFHLGVKTEDVRYSSIVPKLQGRRTEVPELLNAVQKLIKGEGQGRDTLVHRHSLMDPEFRRIDLFYMASEETWGTDNKTPFTRLVQARGELVRKYTARRKAEFETINTQLGIALAALFDGLWVEYDHQKARLAKVV